MQGITAQWTRLKVTAENIAQSQTTRTASTGPYRAKQVTFEAGPDAAPGVRAVVAESPAPTRQEFRPEHPHADQAGWVEMPNVDLPAAQIGLLFTRQAFTANVLALGKAMDMQGEVVDLLR